MSARVACFGEMLLRLAADRGELLCTARELAVHVGGAEANVAIALAHFGHPTAMITVVPQGALGERCVSELRCHGVDSAAVQFAAGRMGLYFLERGAGLRPAQVVYDREHSAFARQIAYGVPWERVLAGAEWLHVSGITAALSAEAAGTLTTGVRAAHARHVRVSFDCNYRPSLWRERAEEAGSVLREIAAHAEILFANAHDLALILGVPPPLEASAGDAVEMFDALAQAVFAQFASVQQIATTQRHEPTAEAQELAGRLATRAGVLHSRVYALRDIIERIGSGDAFAAGILHGALSGFDPQHALEFATAAACLKHTVAEDFSLAGMQHVDALLRGETALRR